MNSVNSIKVLVGPIFILVLTLGCAHKTINAKVSIMKQAGGDALAVSSSTSEAIAWDGAKVKAEEHCFKQGKDFVVVKEESAYQGGDKTAAGIAGAVGGILGRKTSSANLDDYKVKLVFRCEGNYTGKGEPFAETLDLSTQSSGIRW